MIYSPPVVLDHVKNDIAAVVYVEDAKNTCFWKEYLSVFPQPSESAFWTRQRQFLQLVDATKKAQTYQEGWDGYGALPPDEATVIRVLGILTSLRKSQLDPYSVLPSADGGIGIAFRGDSNKRAMLEFLNDGTSSWTFYGKGHPTLSSEFDSRSELSMVIQNLEEYL